MASANTKPAQTTFTSKLAARPAPIRSCTMLAVGGCGESPVDVETIT